MSLKYILKISTVFLLLAFIGIFIHTFNTYGSVISSPHWMLNFKDTGIVMVDRNNKPFFFSNNAREDSYVKLDDISPHLQHAMIAAEDQEFLNHSGLSIKGIVRSTILNIKSGSFSYGGSTITQQLVKNTVLNSKKHLSRKMQEALLALAVEQNFTKDQIMEMYLNTIYYGDGAIGITEASHHYFSKKPKDLTLSESAYIAGMIRYPGMLSPFTGNVKLGKSSQEKVLREMVALKLIAKEQAYEAQELRLNFRKGAFAKIGEAPHFALLVEEKLKEIYGKDVVYEGIKVKTSIDLELQEYAQKLAQTHVEQNSRNGISNAAIVVMHPATGEVLVLVGSKDWFDERNGRVNMAVAPRQPGSSFKPLVYAIALELGLITPATTLIDKPKTYKLADCISNYSDCNYNPKNYDNKYRGKVSVRRALSNSLNVPAVEVMRQVGVVSVLDFAKEFGISTMQDETYYGEGLSVVLGSAEISPFEMANAYAAFANKGVRQEPKLILEVFDKYGNLIYTPKSDSRSVVSPQTAFIISSILSDPISRRETFGNLLATPFPAAVKTGTTDNYRDAWTIGYTPDVVTAVWAGNNNGSYIKNLSGSLAAAPIWKEVMAEVIKKVGLSEFLQPEGLVYVDYCNSAASASAQKEYFIDGTQPMNSCRNKSIEKSFASAGKFIQQVVNIAGTKDSPFLKDDKKNEAIKDLEKN